MTLVVNVCPIKLARQASKESSRLQKKIQIEVAKRSPDMTRINKWKKKSAKHVNKGLRYLDEIEALDKHDKTKEITFKLEKVCFV